MSKASRQKFLATYRREDGAHEAIRHGKYCLRALYFFVGALLALTLSLPAAADETRFTLVATGPRQLDLALSLDPVACLHQKLAPSLTLQAFLAKYAFCRLRNLNRNCRKCLPQLRKKSC